MPEVVKSFETIPSYELMKHNTINLIMNLTEKLMKLNQMFLLNRRDPMTELGFIADVLTFYQFLRPKILDYLERHKDEDFDSLVDAMDFYILNPRKLNVTKSIQAFNMLNHFCEKYKLTSTVIFKGTAEFAGSGGSSNL